MQMQMITATATRENHHQFCNEPDLSDEEWREVSEMRALARTDERFLTYVEQETATEREALAALPPTAEMTWYDVAMWADAYRQLMRAQIAAWKAWRS